MDIVNRDVERYLRGLFDEDHPIAAEMEARAEEHGFPIVGRMVGVTIELLARAIGARRIFEMGSGYGYSGYWFARAAGPKGEIHMTEGDAENQELALEYLGRAGFGDIVHSHVGNALDLIDETEGELDIVFCDIDKGDYPLAWEKARERIRIGGLWICDNVLWSGRVTQEEPTGDVQPGWTERIKYHNEAVARDPRYRSTIVPTRDGVMVALRTE